MLTLQELPVHQFGTQNGDRFIVLSDSGTEVLLGGENGYRVTFEWATRNRWGNILQPWHCLRPANYGPVSDTAIR